MGALVRMDDGALLWTEAGRGGGVPIVLCHGGPGMWDYLEPMARILGDGARVVRWEQRGCGRSSAVGSYTIARFVRDLEALRHHHGHERWIVGGHSWGARLALEYALAHPDRTLGVLYVSGTGAEQAWRAAFHAELDRRLGPARRRRHDELERRERTPAEEREWRMLAFAPDVGDPERAAALVADLVEAPAEINFACHRALEDEQKRADPARLLSRCRRLPHPVLVVHGDRDPRPVTAVESLVAALPRAGLEVLDGVGHFPWLEDPEAFARLASEFVRVAGGR